MGLDVFLRHCPNLADERAKESQASQRADEIWAATGRSYDELSDGERDAVHEQVVELYKSMGLDQYGSSDNVKTIEHVSEIVPEHNFKIGYFRSSYNGSGTNSYLRKMGVPDLYEIMGADGNAYDQQHDWAACSQRAQAAIDQLQEINGGKFGRFGVTEVRNYPDSGVENATEAMKLFQEEFNRSEKSQFKDYSSNKGTFLLSGLKILAVIPQNKTSGFLGNEVYLIYEKDKTEREEDYYVNALKIVKETCDWVLKQEDPNNYFMSWSG